MVTVLNQNLPYPKTTEIAEELFWTHKEKDPFPHIESALLNSADIADYCAQVGMIFPFDPSRLGPASYEMVLGGEYLYWDEEEKQHNSPKIQEKEPLILRKNSITYVSVKETFRIPDYIALRFNLRVRHVHRGLLLGTGPLIDPGFHGNIMIPIHNLTSNDYIIYGDEDLISVEFTKVSRNQSWKIDNGKILIQRGEFKKNSGKNSNKSFEELLKKELPIGVGKVVSSLSGTLADANRQINKANESINENEKVISKYKNISLYAGLTLVIALIALFISTHSVVSDANKYVFDSSMLLRDLQKKVYNLEDLKNQEEIISINSSISQLTKDIHAISNTTPSNMASKDEIADLKKEIKLLNEKINTLVDKNLSPTKQKDAQN